MRLPRGRSRLQTGDRMFERQSASLAITTVVHELCSLGKSRVPAGSPGCGAPRERSDNKSQAPAARPEGVAVRHALRGTIPQTRRAGLWKCLGLLERRRTQDVRPRDDQIGEWLARTGPINAVLGSGSQSEASCDSRARTFRSCAGRAQRCFWPRQRTPGTSKRSSGTRIHPSLRHYQKEIPASYQS